MTATLRERAEHAAKYDTHLVVPAREIKQLLDDRDQAQARIDHLREQHGTAVREKDEWEANAEQAEGVVVRVRAVHAPIDAVHEPTGRHRQVCTGCGTDAGNWQPWPCPTVRALDAAAALAENGDPR